MKKSTLFLAFSILLIVVGVARAFRHTVIEGTNGAGVEYGFSFNRLVILGLTGVVLVYVTRLRNMRKE